MLELYSIAGREAVANRDAAGEVSSRQRSGRGADADEYSRRRAEQSRRPLRRSGRQFLLHLRSARVMALGAWRQSRLSDSGVLHRRAESIGETGVRSQPLRQERRHGGINQMIVSRSRLIDSTRPWKRPTSGAPFGSRLSTSMSISTSSSGVAQHIGAFPTVASPPRPACRPRSAAKRRRDARGTRSDRSAARTSRAPATRSRSTSRRPRPGWSPASATTAPAASQARRVG